MPRWVPGPSIWRSPIQRDIQGWKMRSSSLPDPQPAVGSNRARQPLLTRIGQKMTVVPADEAEVMARYGIIKVPAYRYHYRDWRYSTLNDALAQAKRDEAARSK